VTGGQPVLAQRSRIEAELELELPGAPPVPVPDQGLPGGVPGAARADSDARRPIAVPSSRSRSPSNLTCSLRPLGHSTQSTMPSPQASGNRAESPFPERRTTGLSRVKPSTRPSSSRQSPSRRHRPHPRATDRWGLKSARDEARPAWSEPDIAGMLGATWHSDRRVGNRERTATATHLPGAAGMKRSGRDA
jgi:hypothetical protein